MTKVQVLTEYFLSENHQDNPYFRRVTNGDGDRIIRKFTLRINSARSMDELEVIQDDIHEALEDCGYTNSQRKANRATNYAAIGALGGGLASDSHNAASGALIGAGLGLALSHFVKDDGEDVIAEHVRELKKLLDLASEKMRKVRR